MAASRALLQGSLAPEEFRTLVEEGARGLAGGDSEISAHASVAIAGIVTASKDHTLEWRGCARTCPALWL